EVASSFATPIKLALPGLQFRSGLAGANRLVMLAQVDVNTHRQQLVSLGMVHAGRCHADVPCSCRAPCCSGHRINRSWHGAVDLISHEAHRVIAEQSERKSKASYAVRSAIMIKIYGGQKTSFVDIGRSLKIDPDTVSKYHRIVLRWLMGAPRGKHGPAVEGV